MVLSMSDLDTKLTQTVPRPLRMCALALCATVLPSSTHSARLRRLLLATLLFPELGTVALASILSTAGADSGLGSGTSITWRAIPLTPSALSDTPMPQM